MAKNDPNSTTTLTSTTAVKAPRLGETIMVKAGAGRRVPNNEAGNYFTEKDVVPVTVDVRVLRLLDDLDLIRVK